MGHAESNAIEQWATSVSMKSAEILDGTGREGRKGEKEGKEREREEMFAKGNVIIV